MNPTIEIKHCKKCDQILPIENFRLRMKRGKKVHNSRCRKCEKAYSLEYKQRPEVKRWRRERDRQPERVQYFKQYRENNLELVRARSRASNAKRRLAFPEVRATAKAHCRARTFGATGRFTAEQLVAKFNFWGWRCYLCGCELNRTTVTIDHRKSLSCGGSNWLANIAPCCMKCNRSKRERSEAHFRQWLLNTRKKA